MKEKHIYLILSIALLLISFFTSSGIFYPESICRDYIQKSFFVPTVYFFLIGLSLKFREVNALMILGLTLLIGLLFIGIDVFVGKYSAIILLLMIGSAVVAFFLRLGITAFFKKNEK